MPLNSNQQFFNEPQREVTFSAGTTRIPCFFRKVHYTVCLFTTGTEVLMHKLNGTGLIPSLKWGSNHVVALGLIRYDDSDLGQYNEMILSIPSIPEGIKPPLSSWLDLAGSLKKRKVGQHIIHIPVTSEFSRAAGYELWGYPKIVAPVEHDFDGASVHSKVYDPLSNELIVEVRGRQGFSIPSIPLSLITYSFVSGRLMKTRVKVRGMMKLRLKHNLRLQVGSSNHAIAKDLRLLGLDGKKPFLVMDTEKFQSVFCEGEFIDAEKGEKE